MLPLENFNVSREYGFLPPEGNATALPDEYRAWDDIANALPSLIDAGTVRDKVHKDLPLLSTAGLTEPMHLRRAYSILAMITSAYVAGNGEEHKPHLLPKQLAVPFTHVARSLGLPPILTHSGVVLWNWKRVDASLPPLVENVRSITVMGGGRDEEWFFMLTVQMEYEGAKAIAAAYDAISEITAFKGRAAASAEEEDSKSKDKGDAAGERSEVEKSVTVHLQRISDTLLQLTATIKRMREGNEPMNFFKKVRPFLAGWETDGLIYEGVATKDGLEDQSPIRLSGGSAAQSSLFAAIDIALGVKHMTPEKESGRSFLQRMREYMPACHSDFLAHLEEHSTAIHDFVGGSDDKALKVAFNTCVDSLKVFRDAHIQIVVQYIITPASQVAETSLSSKGTGGTPLIPFLKKTRDEGDVRVDV